MLRHAGGKWRVISREDAWRWLSPHLRIEHYKRFRQSAVAVLAELNPRYDMPVDERIYAGVHKKEPIHSYRLRRAMGETLCLLGLRSPETEEGARAVDIVREVINEIFAAAADWRLWASIDYALLFIAEAAPDLFLKAVEEDLSRQSPATIELFRQSGDSLFGDHPHVEVMWAMEGLMWERAWVTRAALVLARLAALDPGGNCSPRPLGVLREAFLPWLPQCCLDLEDRCRLLDKIMDAEPDIAWRLFLSLLPRTHDVSSPRHRPTYRKIVAPGDNGVTDKEYWEQVAHVARRLSEAAGANPGRWLELVGVLDSFPPDLFDTALSQIETIAVELDAEHRAGIWEALRHKAAEHRFFVKAEWAMPNESLVRIEAVAAKLEPRDPVKRLAWIFSRQRSYLPGTNCDTPYDERESQRTATQVLALREIAAEDGINAIRRLTEQISDYNTGNVGFLTATHNIVHADSDILPAWLEDENTSIKAFARGYAHARLAAAGWEWLRNSGVSQWHPDTFGELASIFPHREDTWKEIEAIGPEFSAAFWRVAGPWIHGATPEQAERVIHELIVHPTAVYCP